MTSRVHTTTTPLDSLSEKDLDEWGALASRSLEPNPFVEPWFLAAAHAHLRPDVHPAVVRVRHDGGLVGILPVVQAGRWKRTPLRAVTTGPPVGSSVSDLHIPLLDPECSEPALAGLVREALRQADVLVLETVRLEGPTYDLLRSVSRSRRWSVEPWRRGDRGAVRPAVDPTTCSPATLGGLEVMTVDSGMVRHFDRGRRRGLVRSINRLTSTLGPLTWTVREPLDDALDEFVRLESSTWKSDPAYGGQGVAAMRGGEAWLRSVMGSLRASGRGLVGELRAGGTLLFSSLAARGGTTYFCLRDAYDQKHHVWSPGTVGRLAEAAWAASVGVSLDSCINPFVYEHASAIYPDRFAVGSLVVARSAVARSVLGVAARVHHRRQRAEG